MQAFTIHEGTVAILWRENVDTDQIIPKDFLKSIKRTGFGEHLFEDWRYLVGGGDNPEFELNKPAAKGTSLLITGNNFGCGSSREHAVWAVMQYGFRAVIAPSKGSGDKLIPGFADIFKSNALKNGLLTIELSLADVEELKNAVQKNPSATMRVDLAAGEIHFGDLVKTFQTDPATKEKLLKGLDDIGMTLLDEDAIREFEARHDTQLRLP